jgi:regulator of protease activity HflC (stomatin/prohibitin superfamily)
LIQPDSNSQFRSLAWGLGIYAVVLLAYGSFLITHPHPLLTTPFGFTLLLVPIWIFALSEILLHERQGRLELSKKRDDHLFNDSYEQVILNRQKQLHRKILLPLCLGIGVMGPLFIAVLQGLNPWQWPPLPEEHLRAFLGFLLFLGAFQFVLGRYYIGIGSSGEKWTGVNTLGGILVYSTLFTLSLALESFFSTESLSFLTPWSKGLSALIALGYPLELLYRGLTYSYSDQVREFPFYCPLWPRGALSQNLKSQAQASLHYQFGYDFSSNIKALLLKHGGPALLIFACCWMGASSIFIVPQGSEAFVTQFGIVQQQLYPAGLHLKYPWPFERSFTVATQSLHRLNLGGGSNSHSQLWDSPEHAKDLHLLVRSPQNLSDQWPIEIWSVNASCDYRIAEAQKWVLNQSEPEKILQQLALRQLSMMHLNTERDKLFDTSRTAIEDELQHQMQAQCEKLGLGVEIIKFSLPQIHPPQESTESFHAVVKARFEKDARLVKAQGFAEQLEAKQKNEAASKLAQAQASAEQKKAHALAELKMVELISPAVALNPNLYWQRKKLIALPEISKDMHKILLLRSGGAQVQTLNLEQSINPEILDLNLETRFNK